MLVRLKYVDASNNSLSGTLPSSWALLNQASHAQSEYILPHVHLPCCLQVTECCCTIFVLFGMSSHCVPAISDKTVAAVGTAITGRICKGFVVYTNIDLSSRAQLHMLVSPCRNGNILLVPDALTKCHALCCICTSLPHE